jgi:ComF family protein
MNWLNDIKQSILHITFPHVCEGCGSDNLDQDQMLCLRCFGSLPLTYFQDHIDNPVEKMFWGRLKITQASAHYYFTKESLMQRLMHGFKYNGNKELGLYLGKLMGKALINSHRFDDIEALVPLPLFKTKERKRGFNQSAILCEGISEVWQKGIIKNAVVRSENTESQTRKNRIERWQNIEGGFEIQNKEDLINKHLLLVDDVVTTGATLEACGRALLETESIKLSLATLCISTH